MKNRIWRFLFSGPDPLFGEHIHEGAAAIKRIKSAPHEEHPAVSVKHAAKALLEKLDAGSMRDPQWEYYDELEALREAIAVDDAAIQNWRAQFTDSGGIQSDPRMKCEICN